MTSDEKPIFEGWCIIELMGHRRLGGMVREQEIAGKGFIRLDVPGKGDAMHATQFYSPQAVYCITPTTEELARKVAALSRPAPVQRYELAPMTTTAEVEDDVDADDCPY